MGQVNEKNSITLSEEDISALECPVCYTIPSEYQIYQCENGHTVCLGCHSKMTSNENCPQCRMKMFKTRFTNFVSEKVLQKLK